MTEEAMGICGVITAIILVAIYLVYVYMDKWDGDLPD